MDAVTRVAAGWTTFGLAAVAAAISYQHLLTLAVRHGETGWRAHAFPLSVDGLEVVASLVLLADRRNDRRSGWLPWTALIGGTVASLCANIIVADHDPVARAIAAWPALALITATKLFLGLAEHHPAPSAPPAPATPGQDAQPADDSGAGDVPATEADQAPMALMRRLPLDKTAYQRWQAAWADLQHNGADPRAVAERHNISLRQIQFIRRAGQSGLLDAPDPPRSRPAAIKAARNEAATPTSETAAATNEQ